MADVFLSYKQTDRARIKPLADALEAEGFSVWWDAEIPLGQTYYSAIETQLAASKVVMPVWTTESVSSEWVREEATKGKHQNKLLPVRLDPVEPPVGFSTIQTADLVGWAGDRDRPEWRTIVSHVRQLAGNGSAEPVAPKVPPKKAKPTTNAFGGSAEVAANPKTNKWKPLWIAGGLAFLGLGGLLTLAENQSPSPLPPQQPPYMSDPAQPAISNGGGTPPMNSQVAEAEGAAYKVATSTRNRSAYETFLKLYPQSSFAADVQRRLSTCRTEQQSATSSMPVTSTGWAVYAMGGCNTAQQTALAYLQQGCLNYSPLGRLENQQYVPSQTVDAMGNPTCVVQAQAVCAFPQATSANYEICE